MFYKKRVVYILYSNSISIALVMALGKKSCTHIEVERFLRGFEYVFQISQLILQTGNFIDDSWCMRDEEYVEIISILSSNYFFGPTKINTYIF